VTQHKQYDINYFNYFQLKVSDTFFLFCFLLYLILDNNNG